MRWRLPKLPGLKLLLVATCLRLLPILSFSGYETQLKDDWAGARLLDDVTACGHLQTAIPDDAWHEDEAWSCHLLQKGALKVSHSRSVIESTDWTPQDHGQPIHGQVRNEIKQPAWKVRIAMFFIWFGIAIVLSHMTIACLRKGYGGTGHCAKAAPEPLDVSGIPRGSESAIQEPSSIDEPRGLLTELLFLLPMAVPLAISHTSKILQDLGTDVLLGRKNTTVLAGVAQALVITTLFENMAGAGISQLAMLCGQAYGAKQHGLVGVWLQMMLILVCILFVPAAGLRFLTKPILLAVGEHEDLADVAGTFAVWSMPCFLVDKWYLSVKEYYASQKIVWPELMVTGITCFATLASVYICVYVFDLGVKGAAIALTITRTCRTILYVAFCYWCGFHKKCWHGWSWTDVIQRDRWRTLLSLVLPSALGIFFELVVVSVASLSAGQLGANKSAAFQLASQMMILSMVIANGIADATGIRMCHYLGSNQPKKARFATHVGFSICIVTNIALAVSFWMFGESIAALVSTDPVVQQELVSNRQRIAVFIGFLGTMMGSSVLLYMQGRGWLVNAITPLCTWLIGLPLILYLSKKQGLPGIFLGLNAGYGLGAACLMVCLFRCDWEQAASDARDRSEAQEGSPKEAKPSDASSH